MVYDGRLAMVEPLPKKSFEKFKKESDELIAQDKENNLNVLILTSRVSKTPAAKMKMVCENCCTIHPQIKPTMPNNVIIMRDSFSARPCPSKSYRKKRNFQKDKSTIETVSWNGCMQQFR